jgi:hypothetical protein
LSHAFFKAYWVSGFDIREDSALLEVMAQAGVENPQAVLERFVAGPGFFWFPLSFFSSVCDFFL